MTRGAELARRDPEEWEDLLTDMDVILTDRYAAGRDLRLGREIDRFAGERDGKRSSTAKVLI